MPVSTEFVSVTSSVSVHVRDWGAGPAVLFLHGWPLSNEMFEYQLRALAASRLRAVALSLRGFGRSDHPWSAYSYDVFADDVHAVLQALELRDITLCGFSMGGAIALRYMARHAGDRVAKLALCGAAAPSFTQRTDYPYGMPAIDVDDLISAAESDRPKMLEDFGKLFCRSENALSPAMSRWLHGISLAASPLATIESLVALRDTDLRPDLDSVRVPTLILHARDDKICPFDFARQLNAGIRDSKLVQFEESGHGLFLEEREKFNRELIAFARGSSGTHAERTAMRNARVDQASQESFPASDAPGWRS